jgi:hypothetical protein
MKVLSIPIITRDSPQTGLRDALRELSAYPNTGPAEYRELDWHPLYRARRTFEIGQAISDAMRQFRPQLTFLQMQTAGLITPGHLTFGGCVVGYNGDMRDEFPPFDAAMGGKIHLHLFANWRDVETARGMGLRAEYMPMGYSPTVFTADGPRPADQTPIVFLANHHAHKPYPRSQERLELATFLRQNYGDRFGLYGSGWPAEWKCRKVGEAEEASIYRGARIAVCQSQFRIAGYTSDRLFRAMACGPAVVADRFPGVEALVPPSTLQWETFAELKTCIDLLLADEQERCKIAEESTEYCRTRHTWAVRMATLVDQLKEYELWQRMLPVVQV